jgi:hypothetical protein
MNSPVVVVAGFVVLAGTVETVTLPVVAVLPEHRTVFVVPLQIM